MRWWLAIVAVTAACGRPHASTEQALPTATAEACVRWLEPRQTGTLQAAQLSEVSGIAASHRLSGVLWLHNDSGHKASLWAVDAGGTLLASFRLKHQPHHDWEDLALGRCSAQSLPDARACLYLADTGDNARARSFVHVLRWPEPDRLPDAAAGPTPSRPPRTKIAEDHVDTFTFSYPDGPEDVEALAVMPDARLILIGKRTDGQPPVFRLTLQPGALLRAELLGFLDVRQPSARLGHAVEVTAADLTSDGRWLLVRTYAHTWVFDLGAALHAAPQEAAVQVAAARAIAVPSVVDGAIEAVAWDPEGGFWQIAEGSGAGIWRIGCAR